MIRRTNETQPPNSVGGASSLTLERFPGEEGPVVCCVGELTAATASILQCELDRLEPMGHPVLTVNLSGCYSLDVDGLMVLLDADRRLRETGRRIAPVVAGGRPGRLLQVLGIADLLPVFPSAEVAAVVLRGGGPPPPAPASWQEARERTLDRWRIIEETLGHDPEEALRLMTSMFALCELSEELFRGRAESAHARCEFCPLFHALGGHSQDFGCRSVLDPMVALVRAGQVEEARTKISELTRMIAEMPILEGTEVPQRRLVALSSARPALGDAPPSFPVVTGGGGFGIPRRGRSNRCHRTPIRKGLSTGPQPNSTARAHRPSTAAE